MARLIASESQAEAQQGFEAFQRLMRDARVAAVLSARTHCIDAGGVGGSVPAGQAHCLSELYSRQRYMRMLAVVGARMWTTHIRGHRTAVLSPIADMLLNHAQGSPMSVDYDDDMEGVVLTARSTIRRGTDLAFDSGGYCKEEALNEYGASQGLPNGLRALRVARRWLYVTGALGDLLGDALHVHRVCARDVQGAARATRHRHRHRHAAPRRPAERHIGSPAPARPARS